MTWGERLNWLSVILAGVTAWFWIKAATAKVAKTGGAYDKPPFRPGSIGIDMGDMGDPGAGGILLGTKTGWLDLPATMSLQSSWNRWAAWASAITALAQALSLLAVRFKW